MRWMLIGMAGLALTGCSRREEPDSATSSGPPARETQTFDVAPPTDGAGRAAAAITAPGIEVTAAPGVAFTYRYGFRLPSGRIEAVQEAHAQACERLGIARCRITGMHFTLVGENDKRGELDFKLDPTLARRFGKDGIAAIEAAQGTLIAASIEGTDAGAVVDTATQQRAAADDEVRRLDALIAHARTGSERAELQNQRAEAARQVAAAAETGAAARASLATTPVTFTYGSGPAVRGFDTSAPFTSALDTAVGSAQATLTVVLAILAIFGPPALAIGLAIFAFLRARAAWRRRRVPIGPAAPAD
ncbi:hypothetical protein [Sphingomonas sp.]|uniref:hypothetical protein n=1 Tax=Sphingomonas sp. TaxID=28214 RepID=UPI003CC53270